MRYTIKADELASQLREKRITQGLSVRQAARGAGVSYVTLSRILRGIQMPDINNLILLARWLDVSLEDFISTADSADLAQPVPDRGEQGQYTPETVARVLRTDHRLKPGDVESLMVSFRAMYDNFVARNKASDSGELAPSSLDAHELS
jgi:transcriptional regulator with XRE-family HTH domain